VTLGLTDAEFYALTPRQYYMLVDTFRKSVEHSELLGGIIAANIANWSMYAPKTAMKPADYMPSKIAEREPAGASKRPKQRINRKAIADNIRHLFANYQAHYEAQQKKKERNQGGH
jgi:hypothetical protein